MGEASAPQHAEGNRQRALGGPRKTHERMKSVAAKNPAKSFLRLMIRAGSSPSETRRQLAYFHASGACPKSCERPKPRAGSLASEKKKLASGPQTGVKPTSRTSDLSTICRSKLALILSFRKSGNQPDENQSGGAMDANGRGSDTLETACHPHAGAKLRRVKRTHERRWSELPREDRFASSQAAKARAVW
jgi:hypothetical protein